MFKPHTLFIVILLIAGSSACKKSSSELPDSVGKIGSLVLVGSTEVVKAADAQLNEIFLKDDESITGGSAFSELLKPTPDEFFQFFSNQKSILVLVTKSSLKELGDLTDPFSDEEIDSLMTEKKARLVFKSDLYAKYQHIVYVFANDEKALIEKLKAASEQLKSSLVQFEVKDQSLKFFTDTALANASFSDEMKRELGMSVQIPNGFKLVEHRHGFWWFEKTEGTGASEKRIGLVAHAYIFNGVQPDLTYNAVISARDTVLKYHVKGEIKGTYMSTSESNAYPARRREEINLNGLEGVKINGWWNIDGIMMSGPFLRYVLKVPDSNRVFAFEGFIYKPNLVIKEKDLRLVESIALSIK